MKFIGILFFIVISKIQQINKDTEIMEMLRQLSDFSQECEYFRHKYGQSLEEYKAVYEAGAEHFEHYDDLMDWEFAEQGIVY